MAVNPAPAAPVAASAASAAPTASMATGFRASLQQATAAQSQDPPAPGPQGAAGVMQAARSAAQSQASAPAPGASGAQAAQSPPLSTEDRLRAQMSSNWDKLPDSTREAMIAQAENSASADVKLGDIVHSGNLGDLAASKVTSLNPPPPTSGDEGGFSSILGGVFGGANGDLRTAQTNMEHVQQLEKTLANYGKPTLDMGLNIESLFGSLSSPNVIYKPVAMTPEQTALAAFSDMPQPPPEAMTKEEATAYVADLRSKAETDLASAQARVDGQKLLQDAGWVQASDSMLSKNQGDEFGLKDASMVYWSDDFGLVTPAANVVPEKESWFEKALGSIVDFAVPLAVGGILGPAAGAAFASAVGAGAVGTAAITGFTTSAISGLASGKDFDDALRGGFAGAVTGGLGAGVTSKVADGLGVTSDLGRTIVDDVVTGVGQGVANGGDIGESVKGQLIGSVAQSAGVRMHDGMQQVAGDGPVSDMFARFAANVTTDALVDGDVDFGADLRGGLADTFGPLAGSLVKDRLGAAGDGGMWADFAGAAGDAVGSWATGTLAGQDVEFDFDAASLLKSRLEDLLKAI